MIGIGSSFIAGTMRFASLSPRLIHKIIKGEISPSIEGCGEGFPILWSDQEEQFWNRYNRGLHRKPARSAGAAGHPGAESLALHAIRLCGEVAGGAGFFRRSFRRVQRGARIVELLPCTCKRPCYDDIREHFQGRRENGMMNSSSTDERYNELLAGLRSALRILEAKIAPKVYEYGFLLK